MIPANWLYAAQQRVAPHIRRTALTYDPDRDFYLKWENQQVTGSFKARGAFNKVLTLEDWERTAGLLAASAGNHGMGVALAGKTCHAPVTIYAAENASPVKIEGMRKLGAEVILTPGGYTEAEQAALKRTAESDSTWVSPYNDGQVIAGQGTVGLEMLEQLAPHPKFQLRDSTWVIPASGGGLLAGIGAALSTLDHPPRLVGVQAENSSFTYHLFHTGSQAGVVESPTIADGLAGEVEAGSITIPLIRQFADDFILVSEAEIRAAIAFAWEHYGEKVEGSAAAALAAALSGKVSPPVVLVMSGGNIDPQLHAEIIGKTT